MRAAPAAGCRLQGLGLSAGVRTVIPREALHGGALCAVDKLNAALDLAS